MANCKTVYYLNHYTINDSLKRGEYLATELKKIGVDLILVGADNHHQKKISGNQKELFKLNMTGDTRVVSVKTRQYFGNGIKRLLNMFDYATAFYKKDFIKELNLPHPCTLIVSSGHMFHYHAIKRIAKKYNCKIIFEVRDIWPLSLIELLNTSRFHPLIILMSILEKYAYKKSDKIVSLLPNAYLHFEQRGMKREKFVYIPNGYSFDSCHQKNPEDNLYLKKIKDYKSKGYKIVMYTGALGVPNNMFNIIYAMEKLKDEKIRLLIFGNGTQKEELELYIKTNELENVEMCGFVEKSLISRLISAADFTFASVKNKDIYKYGLSLNKFFEYMALKKPVIAAIESRGNVVELSGAGIVVPPDSVDDLVQAIKLICDMDPLEISKMGELGYQYCLENHSYKTLATRYANLF